ncbi:Fic family protein [Knoellia remsis]|uniref:Fic family protein n=1 Tax=Knoellia remsis TaxID=407159 RepID=A0A2T0UHX8_9MICO|nr:Fic family protein [Knoellia remsis]PRY57535.1 Fic family protein [Knoellia remsis]
MADAAALALRWEEIRWEPTSEQPLSRAQRARIQPTYAAAVPADIATMEFAIDSVVAAEADDARDAIARFDTELSAMFPSEFAPLSSVLLRTESASSSQIENITTGARALALAEIGAARYGSNASLVAANVDAMNRAVALADRVTPQAILDIHEALMRDEDYARPGRFRDEQVWIGPSPTPHGALFVPPHHDRVAAGIDDLCVFTERTDLPLLTHVAIAHAQFETIHPFNDGNGRTGRALMHALLKAGGATTRTTLPVSAGLLKDTDAYFDALTAYRLGDPGPIVAQFTHAAFAAVDNGRRLARDLETVYAAWSGRVSARRHASVWRVLPLLLSQPALTSATLQERAGISQPTADNALRQLVDARILQRSGDARRNVVYVATDVVEALDAFAARARRG